MPAKFLTRKPINFHMVENFRDRVGFAVVASVNDSLGQPLDYECTKQYTTPQGAMDGFTGWMRRMSVEDEMK